MPYTSFYLDVVEQDNEIHFLYWNRDGKDENRKKNIIYHEFNYKLNDDVPKIKKCKAFYMFKRYVDNLFQKESFDLVIIHQSVPACLLKKYLCQSYSRRFIFDYRDYTYEKIFIYKFMIHDICKHSLATFVSSNAFRMNLPTIDKIYTSHNLILEDLEHKGSFKKNDVLPIRIGFWGYIRHPKINMQIIDRLLNDSRFELHFYGREQEIAQELKIYANSKKALNVFFHGEYEPSDRYKFVKKIDLIHNIYSNSEAPSQKYAITNKYYEGLIFKIPQLCMKDSYMGQLVEEYQIGVTCNPYIEDFAEQIWKYYHTLNIKSFCDQCDNLLNAVLKEYYEGRKVISNAVQN